MTATTTTNSFLQRLVGAAALDSAIYEEVEADLGATTQACGVVLLFSLAAGLGAVGLGASGFAGISSIAIVALLSWAGWALVTYAVGGQLLPEPQTRVDVGELLRTIGFATTPGLLCAFGVIPGAAAPAFLVAAIWMLVAMVVAVRQALDYTSTLRAVLVCVFGWLLAVAIAVVGGAFFGPAVS